MQGRGHGKHAVYRAHAAVERQLAQEREFGEAHRIDLPGGRQDANGYGQVESRAFLLAVGRREVDGDLAARPLIAGVFDGRQDALFAFADCGVGQADDREGRQTAVGIDFNVDRVRVNPERGGREDSGGHGVPFCVRHTRTNKNRANGEVL